MAKNRKSVQKKRINKKQLRNCVTIPTSIQVFKSDTMFKYQIVKHNKQH